MDNKNKRRTPMPNTGSEEIPPGATRHASDWPGNMGNDDNDQGAGPRHEEPVIDEEYQRCAALLDR